MLTPIRATIARATLVPRLLVVVAMVVALTACQAAASPPRTIALQTLSDSGVTGTVAFTTDGGGKTAVLVTVDPAGNLDMPAHIHPGSCDSPTPQPKFPLQNVRDGVSNTVVPASIDELFAGGLMINIHRSNDDLKAYTACVDLR